MVVVVVVAQVITGPSIRTLLYGDGTHTHTHCCTVVVLVEVVQCVCVVSCRLVLTHSMNLMG